VPELGKRSIKINITARIRIIVVAGWIVGCCRLNGRCCGVELHCHDVKAASIKINLAPAIAIIFNNDRRAGWRAGNDGTLRIRFGAQWRFLLKRQACLRIEGRHRGRKRQDQYGGCC